MFTSPYSPFFMSGLLSYPVDHQPDDRPPSPDVPPGPRRGSLPTDTSTRSVATSDQVSAFYFTLQPRRDEQEYRSFLSLDLAESQSLRSASLKRKASTKKTFKFPSIPETSTPRANSLRTRFSRDSLRTIPSPKPAPSITLPELPVSPPLASAPPRLPSLPSIPALELPLPALSVRVSRTHFPFPAPPRSKRFSVATKATASTVSTRVRRANRSAALATLEGRAYRSTPILVSPKHAAQSNFMSMSDDEDDDAMDVDADDEDSDLDSLDFADDSMFSALMEPEDVVFPLRSPTYLEAPRSAPLPPQYTASQNGRPAPPPRPLSTSVWRPRPKRRSAKEWFPLQSFIDLHNDDDSSNWSWRSFIEVNVS